MCVEDSKLDQHSSARNWTGFARQWTLDGRRVNIDRGPLKRASTPLADRTSAVRDSRQRLLGTNRLVESESNPVVGSDRNWRGTGGRRDSHPLFRVSGGLYTLREGIRKALSIVKSVGRLPPDKIIIHIGGGRRGGKTGARVEGRTNRELVHSLGRVEGRSWRLFSDSLALFDVIFD